jgi:hypothetical protein
MQARQKNAGRFANFVGDHRALLQFEIKGRADKPLWYLQQRLSQRHQLFRRQTAVSLIHGLGQRVGNPRAHPHHSGLLDPELHRYGVGGLETDAPNIARQAIGVLGHDLDGVSSIGLENPHRPRRADTMAVQEDHDFPNRLLFCPSSENAGSANRPDAVDLSQPIGRSLNNVEHLFAEGANEFLRVCGANAPDHPGREVFLDAVGRCRG